MNKYLLDCTLRDGGYINDWEFGREYIANIFERQVSSGVDVIEIGFLDERRSYDPNRTIMPGTAEATEIFGGFDHGDALVVGMIDYGTCSLAHIQPKEETCLDGIRVIFKKGSMHEAIAFCKQCKALGYKMFVQAVSITSYNDKELNELVDLVNDCHPYAMSMVDTYGLLDAAGLEHIVSVIDKHLEKDVILGYHAHNNFQLGYANAVSFLNMGLQRDVLVDGTLYGMGKSAGNAPIELIAMYMNTHCNKHYDVLQMQEAIANSILELYRMQPWGYTLFYYIAAANKCHPDYVSYLMNKRTLSISAVNEILQQIPEEEKLGKNKKMIEQLYLRYQAMECDDTDAVNLLREKLKGAKVLLLGPGRTMQTQQAEIRNYIDRNRPIIISINYLPDYVKADYIFVTNSRRYHQMVSPRRCEIPIIATSNVTRTGGEFPYVVNYSALIDETAEIPDNSMVMLIKLLARLGVEKCALAGFDGYTPDTVNYFDKNKEYSFVKQRAEELNQYARDFFRDYAKKIEVSFVTRTHYLNYPD